MKTSNKLFVASRVTMAVQAALLAMFAVPQMSYAQDEGADALTRPSNTVEVGIAAPSISSAKFGEYSGLNKSDASLVGNINIRGGDAYGMGGGTQRWEIKASDLGTTSREIGANVSEQGQWSAGVSYDELRHNISDTYQTPFVGSLGANTFILPPSYGVINTAYINSSKQIGTQALSASQVTAMNTTDVHSDRKNTSLSAGYAFDRQWNVKFDFNRLDQSGAKLISPATDASKYGTFNSGFEKTLMLMNPTDYQTDTFNVVTNWTGDAGYMSASYFGSLFHDNINGLNFSNPFLQSGSGATATAPLNGAVYAGAFPVNTLSTAPSNEFHQLNLGGGYTFTPTTKLVGGLSYGRNTQNAKYESPLTVDMQTGGLPATSLDALVISTHADLKLTDQTTKDLLMSAGVKYNKRDNQTAAQRYKFIDLGGVNESSVNIPMSNSKTQLEVAGDYRIDKNHRLHLGVEYEDIKRWCNDALANSTQGALTTYVSSSCVQIPESKENRLVAGYRLKAGDSVNFNTGYTYSDRAADVNATFYNPMQTNSQGYENYGYRAFFDASRKEQMLKAGVNWQADEQLGLGMNIRYLDDKYNDSPLGVQTGKAWTANWDASYNLSEEAVLSAYYSVQKRQREMLSGGTRSTLVAATNLWTNQLNDATNTLGIAFVQKGLMAGKLQLQSDLSYTTGATGYSTQVPYSIATTAIPTLTCGDTQSLTCGSTPDFTNEVTTLRVTGLYTVDKSSKVSIGYVFQKQAVTDYYYNGYQNGYTASGVLPTNEQAPNYSVNVVSVSYIYNF